MVKGRGRAYCKQEAVFVNAHKVKPGQCMSETTTFSKLLELEVSDKEWQEKQWERSHAVEHDLNSLGSAELLKSVNRGVGKFKFKF